MFAGTKEDWARVERAGAEFDPLINKFANSHGLRVSSNCGYDKVGRQLVWKKKGVKRHISLMLSNPEGLLFNIQVFAQRWRGPYMHSKYQLLRTNISLDQLRSTVTADLESARTLLNSWSARDLTTTDGAWQWFFMKFSLVLAALAWLLLTYKLLTRKP
jgi:hypothetical protein